MMGSMLPPEKQRATGIAIAISLLIAFLDLAFTWIWDRSFDPHLDSLLPELAAASLAALAALILVRTSRALLDRIGSLRPWSDIAGDSFFVLSYFLLVRSVWRFPTAETRPGLIALALMAAICALATAKMAGWMASKRGVSLISIPVVLTVSTGLLLSLLLGAILSAMG